MEDKASRIHQQIMNLPDRYEGAGTDEGKHAYKCGFRDARHAAAELSQSVVGDLERVNGELYAELKSWVDYFDQLDRESEPGDPLIEARRRYHAKRLERSRAALAKAE